MISTICIYWRTFPFIKRDMEEIYLQLLIGIFQNVLARDIFFNSFLTRGDFRDLLITFVNSLDPDQDRQNVCPDLDILSVLIWIQTVWHPDSLPELIFDLRFRTKITQHAELTFLSCKNQPIGPDIFFAWFTRLGMITYSLIVNNVYDHQNNDHRICQYTVLPAKSDSDVIFCLQLLC